MANKNVFNNGSGLCGEVPNTGSNSSPSRNRPVIWVALALPLAPGLATPSHTKQQWDITQVQSQRVQVSGMVRLEQSSGLLFL